MYYLRQSRWTFQLIPIARIPRDEVEEMGRVVTRELEELEPGCVSTIVGG